MFLMNKSKDHTISKTGFSVHKSGVIRRDPENNTHDCENSQDIIKTIRAERIVC